MAVPSFNIAPGESSDAAAYRRKLALLMMQQGMNTSPIQHWTQGAARVAQSIMGGLELGREDAKEAKEKTAAREMYGPLIQQLFGGAAPQAAAPAVAPQAAPNVANKVYGNNEPSPLDPPSGPDRDMLIRTVLAEAGNQGPEGQKAVAAVARNRAASGQFGGDTLPGVLQKPYQFEPWNTQGGRQRMAGIDPNSPQYQAAGQAVEQAYAGQDPTKGATHFYAPKAQAALGRPAPAWDNGSGKDIGDHRFFGGAGTQQVTAGAAPTDVSAQRLPQTAQAGGVNVDALKQMLGNKYLAPTAQAIIQQKITEQFKAQDYDFKQQDDGSIVAINKKNPRDYKVINPTDPQAMIDHEAKKKGAIVTAEELAKRAVAQPEKDRQSKATADIVSTDIDRAIKTIDTSILPTTGAVGGLLSNVGGTAARDVSALLDTVKANAGFDTLSKMRAASPTGGALGSITEKELALLQATVGNLEQSQTADQLKDNLRRLKNVQLDIIHGPGNGPAREVLSFKNKPADGGVTEGATATNPQTGQKIMFKSGQWVPVQ